MGPNTQHRHSPKRGHSPDSSFKVSSSSAATPSRKSLFGLVSSGGVVGFKNPAIPTPPRIPSLVRLNSKVDMKSAMNLRGYNERLNSAESAVFLGRVIAIMRPRLLQATASSGADIRSRVEALDRYAVKVCREIRVRIHRQIARLVIDSNRLLQSVTSCKWDIHELSSRNHDYIDTLVTNLKDAAGVVEAHGRLPGHIGRNVYRGMVEFVMRSLIGCYSRLKRCTTEGRASMSLDLNVFRSQAVKLRTEYLKPLPLWEYANDFVKAFYLPEEDLCKWIAEHPGYPISHYRNIAALGAGASMRSKRRDRLLQRVEAVVRGGEFSRNRRSLETKEKEEEVKKFHTL
uniref:Syndetin C-terminal domain-containing protein n=1 Tax=Amorphochlora amoebiformis TaxID=1561963 RepID=A0A7S0DR85_9EUKA|mmetsp:Transcript_6983/g.10818  ORF Transcript_6983/g.10818 Transcript_6983/m.10818 type:complete len:344 (+) Transcript_6983:91-1122(+)